MTIDIRWAKKALADLDEIDDHYAAIDLDLATEIGRRVFAANRFLAETPKAGPILGSGQRRKWSVREAPYVLIYRPHSSHLTILRVRHNRERWRPTE